MPNDAPELPKPRVPSGGYPGQIVRSPNDTRPPEDRFRDKSHPTGWRQDRPFDRQDNRGKR